jgi:hypothetical protein
MTALQAVTLLREELGLASTAKRLALLNRISIGAAAGNFGIQSTRALTCRHSARFGLVAVRNRASRGASERRMKGREMAWPKIFTILEIMNHF